MRKSFLPQNIISKFRRFYRSAPSSICSSSLLFIYLLHTWMKMLSLMQGLNKYWRWFLSNRSWRSLFSNAAHLREEVIVLCFDPFSFFRKYLRMLHWYIFSYQTSIFKGPLKIGSCFKLEESWWNSCSHLRSSSIYSRSYGVLIGLSRGRTTELWTCQALSCRQALFIYSSYDGRVSFYQLHFRVLPPHFEIVRKFSEKKFLHLIIIRKN